MVYKLWYLIFSLFFMILFSNILYAEIINNGIEVEKQFKEDYNETIKLLNELNLRIYNSGIDHKQLKLFKDEVLMAQNLFNAYLLVSREEIHTLKSVLRIFEKKQTDATRENVHEDISLYRRQKDKVKKYTRQIKSIEKISRKLEVLMSEIQNRHIQINDAQSTSEYKNDFNFTVTFLNAMDRRIDQTKFDRKQLIFFKNQLILLKNLFEKYLKIYHNKVTFWNNKLRYFENNHANPTIKETRQALSIYKNRNVYLKKYRLQITKIDKILSRIDILLNILINMRVRVSDRLLFSSQSPFYESQVWSLVFKNINSDISKLSNNIRNTYFVNKSFLSFELWCLLLLIYTIFYRRISNFINIVAYNYIHLLDIKANLTYLRQFTRIILISYIPGHIIYFLINSLTVSESNTYSNLGIDMIFDIGCSLCFSLLLYATLTSFYRNFKKVNIGYILFCCFAVFLILTNNNINAFSFSTQFYPLVSIYSVALINLVICIIFSTWGLIVLSKLTNKLKTKCGNSIFTIIGIVCLYTLSILSPIFIFIGYSNLVVGFFVNCLQSLMVVYYLFLIYMILNHIFNITVAYLYAYYSKNINIMSSKEKYKIILPYVIQEDITYKYIMYWCRMIFGIVICFSAILLVLLAWGAPPSSISEFLKIILYSPFPIRENSTFALYNLISSIFILLCCYCMIFIIGLLTEIKILKHTTAGSGTIYAIKMIIRYLGIVISLIIFVYALGVNSKTMAFVISGLSIGVGFALKDTLSNFFSSIIILVGRKIRVGDWVYSKDSMIEGNIEHIGLDSTVIRGFEKRTIIVPNIIINSQPIVNASRMSHRRIKQYIGIRYKDINVVGQIITSIKGMLLLHNEIDSSMKTVVKLVDGNTDMGTKIEGCFGSYSINIEIFAYTKTTHWIKFNDVQGEIMLVIADIIKKYGAEITFPTSNIKLITGKSIKSQKIQSHS